MSSHNRSKSELWSNPEEHFPSPAYLAASHSLTIEHILKALQQWEQSVQARLAANNEGMPANGKTADDLLLMTKIEAARRLLSDKMAPRRS